MKHSASIHKLLFRAFPLIFLAAVLSIIGGAFSSLIGVLIGPALQGLFSTQPSFSFLELFGNHFGRVLEFLTQNPQIERGVLFSVLPFCLIGVTLGKNLCVFINTYIWEYLSERTCAQIRFELIQKFLGVDPSKRAQLAKEEDSLAGGISSDLKIFREYILHFYGGLPREAMQIGFLCFNLLFLSPKLFAIFFAGVLPGFFFIQRIGTKLKKRAERALSDYSQLSEWIQQRLLGIETIKNLRTENHEIQNFQQFSVGLFERFYKAARSKSKTAPTLEFSAILAVSIVLWIAFAGIAKGELSGSIMISFMASLALLSQSAHTFSRYFNANKEGNVAMERIQKTLDQFQTDHVEELDKPQGSTLSLNGMTATWADASSQGTRHGLLDFTFEFYPGRIYCVCGPSGSGKSTLLRVILGLKKLDHGTLSRPVTKHDIGYLPQSLDLPATLCLGEILSYPDKDFDEGKAKAALINVGLREFSPTFVPQAGQGLSGGQTQRVFMARLLYRKPRLILIDEGTSAVDGETEQALRRHMVELKNGGAIVIFVTHRLAVCQEADVVLTLENGRLKSTQICALLRPD